MEITLDDNKFERPELYERLTAMTEEQRIAILDPICDAVCGKVKLPGGGIEVLANRIFALLTLELYREWQIAMYNRE